MSGYDTRAASTADRDALTRAQGLGACGTGASDCPQGARRDRRQGRSRRRIPQHAPSRPRGGPPGRGFRARAACAGRAAPPPRRRLARLRGGGLACAEPPPYDSDVSKQEPEPEPTESLPAWSLAAGAGAQIAIGVEWPERVTRDWAWGGSTGKGVTVCILDSGVESGHPLVGDLDRAVAFKRGETRRRHRARGGHRRRPLRPRHGLRRNRALARARLQPRQRARARRRLQGQRPGAARRPALGGRAGVRRDQHEPLDHEAPVRRPAARARRHRLLPPYGARCLRAQHARRELPLALLLRDLGRKPRGARAGRPSSTTLRRPSSSSRAESASRSRGSAVARSSPPATASPRRT